MNEFMASVRSDWQVTLPFLILYLASTCVDVMFGLVVAFTTQKLCSTVSRAGMMRKFMMLGTVLLAALFDGVLPSVDLTVMGVHLNMTFGALGCVWWMIHELLSIIEHAAVLGMPMPARLRDALAVVHNALDKTDDESAQPAQPATETTPKPPPDKV